MSLDPLSLPFILSALVVAAVVVLLGAVNARALRAVLRPGGALGEGPARTRSRYAWLLSVTAFFSGPVAPVLGVGVLLLGLWARRTVQTSTLRDPLDLAAATAAVFNGVALVVGGGIVVAAVWATGMSAGA